jgi:polyphenol oxidase
MKKHQQADLVYYQFNHLSQMPQIDHFVSTRQGGASQDYCSTMNLSLNVNDDWASVIQNRQKLAHIIETDLKNFVFANQTHSSNICKVDNTMRGRGVFDYQTSLKNTDALITQETDICLMTLGADCVPILFYSPDNQVIAVAHSGWRGTVSKIAAQVIRAMQDDYGCKPAHIRVGIAPCISVQNYEIGEEVAQAVRAAFGEESGYLIWNEKTQKFHFDLVYANQQQLQKVGVKPENIETSGFCTFANSDIFFSARHDQGKTGRFGAGIRLKKSLI